MSSKLPYVSYPNGIAKVLDKVKKAKTPERFTTDFLKTKIGYSGGNYRQFIPLAKKLELLNSDGTPTNLYKKFRNSSTSEAALAQAIKKGYKEIFDRNEYADDLSDADFKGLVVEITGRESNDRVVKLICQTFNTLKEYADFEKKLEEAQHEQDDDPPYKDEDLDGKGSDFTEDLELNLAYTINLVLPKTDDPAVFNAIFKALRENLLRR